MLFHHRSGFNRWCIIAAMLVAGVSSTFSEAPGFKVAGRFLYDKCGEKVILRGINKMTIWTDINGASFPEIAKTGANSVRICWLTTGDLTKFDAALKACKDNKMIPIPELHDATGKWDQLSTCVNWWIKPEVVSIIQKHEEYMLINIANECGETVSNDDFKTGYTDAIKKMRAAGIHVPIVIDAAKYGQDIDILQAVGPDLITADPDHNILLSVHMWWPVEWGWSDQKITDEVDQSVKANLPLIVGEFAHNGIGCKTNISYKHIIDQCQKNEIGWLVWEWGPGNNDCVEMDMTPDSKFESLKGWGLEVCTTDPNSIKNTAVRPKFILDDKCEGAQVSRFSVSVIVKGRGSVTLSPNKSMVDSGTTITLKAVADAGNQFVKWSGSKDGSATELTFAVIENMTITAEFSDNGPAVGAELITNGDFSKDTAGWKFEAFTPAVGTASVINGEFVANMTTKGTDGWNAQLKKLELDIVKGKKYVVSFKVQADQAFVLSTNVGLNEGPWTTYSGYQKFNVTSEMKTYTYEFTMGEASDRKARMVFDLGTVSGKVIFDDISLKPVDDGSSATKGYGKTTVAQNNIRVFLNRNHEIMVQLSQTVNGSFELIDIAGKSVCKLGAGIYHQGSYALKFPLNTIHSGTYFVRLNDSKTRFVSSQLTIIK
jgi:hypothetical protein